MSDLPWHDPAFLPDVTAWIDARLADAGLHRTGPIEQRHIAWWSTALAVPTDDGPMWCKAVQPDGRFEARLTPLLASRWPDRTVEVVATDPERGLLLTRDAGTKLRELSDGRVVEHWEALLPQYAEMQRELAGSDGDLVALGVPELRLAPLAGELASLLDEPELLLGDRDDGVDADRLAQLRAGLPAFADACARLAALPIPETLQHDDLNDGNTFLRGPITLSSTGATRSSHTPSIRSWSPCARWRTGMHGSRAGRRSSACCPLTSNRGRALHRARSWQRRRS
jgi:hypothetical protein